LIGLLGELATFGAVVSEYRQSGTTDWIGFALFTLLMAIPIALGLWLANVGDPGLGRRFGTDLVVSVSRLRQPSAIAAALRISIGLAFATALAAVLLMLVVRPGSAIALVGLSAYSLVDPALNVSRRSWWLSAVLSAGTWLALFATLAGTADAIQPMREGVMIFMLPMLLYAAARHFWHRPLVHRWCQTSRTARGEVKPRRGIGEIRPPRAGTAASVGLGKW
jgi:hypothetical protein